MTVRIERVTGGFQWVLKDPQRGDVGWGPVEANKGDVERDRNVMCTYVSAEKVNPCVS